MKRAVYNSFEVTIHYTALEIRNKSISFANFEILSVEISSNVLTSCVKRSWYRLHAWSFPQRCQTRFPLKQWDPASTLFHAMGHSISLALCGNTNDESRNVFLNTPVQCSVSESSRSHGSSDIMRFFATSRGGCVQPLDRSISARHLLFVLQHSASLDTSAEYLLQRLSPHLFHTPVFTPLGIIMLRVNKYVLSTSLQKWAKHGFLPLLNIHCKFISCMLIEF